MGENWKVVFDWTVEIWFRIEKDGEGYPRSKNWEQLLAFPVLERNDYFCIESIPFFIKGISRGDIVHAKVSQNEAVQESEFFEFSSLIEHGGHNTYRLLLREVRPNDPQLTERELLDKGLLLEVEDGDFFAVDVPPTLNQQEIDEYLIAENRSGRWGLQDGNVRRGFT
jgi:hypothetical protein